MVQLPRNPDTFSKSYLLKVVAILCPIFVQLMIRDAWAHGHEIVVCAFLSGMNGVWSMSWKST